MFHRTLAEPYCDAPPYSIVRACRMIGFTCPEDVRWTRLSSFRKGRYRSLDIFNVRSWCVLFGLTGSCATHCSCGLELPQLDRYTFTCVSGRQVDYYLGQCRRCHSVFWE